MTERRIETDADEFRALGIVLNEAAAGPPGLIMPAFTPQLQQQIIGFPQQREFLQPLGRILLALLLALMLPVMQHRHVEGAEAVV